MITAADGDGMPDPFTQALHDHHFGEQRGPLVQRCGETTREHDVESYVRVTEVADTDDPDIDWVGSWLAGPVLDMGAGVGCHALPLQDHHETVAVEQSEPLVAVLRDRGVDDARVADMFALREAFDRDCFRSALAFGTQVGLAGSMAGLREFLADLAYVTTPDATVVFDGFNPDREATTELLDYRPDPTPGLAHRVAQFEYDGHLSEPWLSRLFSLSRIREAVVGTDWTVADVTYGDGDWSHTYHVGTPGRVQIS
jgi:hypothetical protein